MLIDKMLQGWFLLSAFVDVVPLLSQGLAVAYAWQIFPFVRPLFAGLGTVKKFSVWVSYHIILLRSNSYETGLCEAIIRAMIAYKKAGMSVVEMVKEDEKAIAEMERFYREGYDANSV